jgi:N-acetylornithine carbamoyltransferase
MERMKPHLDHFINVADFTQEQLNAVIDAAVRIKKGKLKPSLKGRNLILLFFDPSLRTRTSFELAMMQLGGNVVTLNAGGDTWKLEIEEGVVMDGPNPEHIKDAAKVLGRYAEAIGVRSFPRMQSWEKDREDPVLGAFVKHAGVPVINLESSLYHPNQALGDIMTIQEKFGKDLKGLPIAVSWANHPKPLPMAVPNSILLASALFGMDVRLVRPEGYDLDERVMAKAKELTTRYGGTLTVTDDVRRGFGQSKVVYAKSWGSIGFYGRPQEEASFRKNLSHWIVDDAKMAMTDSALFMHCLPVRRNVVVADSVIDGPRSIIYDEAENRLHIQKSVLAHILGE